MSNIKDTVSDAAHVVGDAAKNIGHKIAAGATEAKDWVAEKIGLGAQEGSDAGVAGIKERMDVIASCGKKVGVVDHVVGNSIQLTKGDSPDGQHHFIPTGWVEHVDSHVHLKKNAMETEQGWKSDAASCGSCAG